MATERLSVSQVEAVIRQLRDVIGVRVVSDPAGVIQEIHVLTQSQRAPKQVVRDVESALQARLGITLDHKKVSVAQVQSGHAPAETSRMEFVDVSVSLTGTTAEAVVRVKRDGSTYSGSCTGSSTTAGQIKSVASATLSAVASAVPDSPTLLVEDVCLHGVGEHQVLTVLATWIGNRTDEVLCGSCIVKQDPIKTAVFAALDAVNRRISSAN
ncbi:MAG: hypothetical protein IT209_05265 [Armatimonadetes bacterium]|nr:hypothetical protein [Armatimonadota bacterium]